MSTYTWASIDSVIPPSSILSYHSIKSRELPFCCAGSFELSGTELIKQHRKQS